MMGFHGKWKYAGLSSIGIITLDTDCRPKKGVYVEPPFEEDVDIIVEVEKEIIYIDREVIVEKVLPPIIKETEVIVTEIKIEEKDPMVLIAAVCAVLLLIVILNLVICVCCIRKHKKRVDVLER